MELPLRIVGVLLIALAIMHAFFPRWFQWERELGALSLINRQMMRVHTAFIALILLLMGVLCLASTADLVGTPLGRRICGGLGIFWSVRLVVQFVGYSPQLWRGKRFETAVHIACALLWAAFTVVFLVAARGAG